MSQFDIKGLEATPQKVEEAKRSTNHKVEPAFGVADAFKFNPQYQQLADFLGLKGKDKDDIELANKISFIRDYTKEKDELDAMVKIRNMIRDLGIQSKGKDLITNLYKFTRLSAEREKIDKEISLLNGREYPTTTR